MNLRSQLVEFEGRVAYAYPDSMGFLTIGVGRLVDKRKGGHLSDAEIDFLLDNDIAAKSAEVLTALTWAQAMNEPRQAVLIGMCFQMGLKGLLGFTGTLEAMRDERYADAAERMRQSLWARQTPNRARRMAHQLEVGEWA